MTNDDAKLLAILADVDEVLIRHSTATVPATPTSTTDAARHAAQTTDAINLLLLIAR